MYRRSGSGITAGKQQEVRELLDEERRVRSVLLSQTAPVTDSESDFAVHALKQELCILVMFVVYAGEQC